MERVNVVVIGGGVVGCAVAMECAAVCEDVFVVEKMPKVGMGASTRNSGVIHSGMYYAAGSKKARHCVEGNRLTYEFCAAHGVEHRRTGKLVVAATEEEERELEVLVKKGEANGVAGLRIVDRAAIQAREPHIEGRAAIDVPSAGILLSEELVKAYARAAVGRGASILTHAQVTAMEARHEWVRVRMKIGEDADAQEEVFEAKCVVNAAGLYADEVAEMVGTRKWKIWPVRGEYAEVTRAKAELVRGLVYPMPHPTGLSLGVHFTKTLWGSVLVGPTARYVARKDDYESGRDSVEEFARRAQGMLPEITAKDLTLAYSGIRAKLTGPEEQGPADFVIERDANCARVIQLVGIESPGLTAAGSIAKEVAGMVKEAIV